MSHPANTNPRPIATRLGPLNVATIGEGPPAVLWHNLFVDSTTWSRVLEPLAALRRLIVVDAPNHGGQPPVGPFALADCIGVARDILDTLGITEPVDWLGNAMGGRVGVLFAEAHPDRCRTLTAIGAPINAYSTEDRRKTALLMQLYRIAGPGPVTNLLVDVLLGPAARADDPDGAAIVAEAFRRADRTAMYDAVRWLSIPRRDLTPVLDRLDTPTVLTTGPDDPMWTTADARAAAAHLRNGALVILSAAGYVGPLLQAAPEVVELVTAFWADPQGTVAARRETVPGRAAP